MTVFWISEYNFSYFPKKIENSIFALQIQDLAIQDMACQILKTQDLAILDLAC